MNKSVIILGGGLAGLSAAVFLSNKGYNISVYESSPKWGGRTYSYFDKEQNIFIDNGKHILAGFYENTFEFMKIIGTYGNLKIKENLELVFCDKNKNVFNFKCGNLPGVLSLLTGIFRFKGFSFKDKVRFLKIRLLLKKEYSGLVSISTADLLEKLRQTENLMKYFWIPLVYASFNTLPENVSADLFVKLIKKGTENKKNMSIILGENNLNGLFIDKSLEYLSDKSVSLHNNLGGVKINLEEDNIKSIELENGNTVSADYYVSAVPFYSFVKLFQTDTYKKYFNECNLKSSTIISVHLFFNKDLDLKVNSRMTGLLDTTVQWVFVESKRQLSLVISAADYIGDNLTEKHNAEIFKICIDDLKSCLAGFDEDNIIDYKVIKEKRATFLPEAGSENSRFIQKSNIRNLFIAGDWTDTGLPATIESAVKSAKLCTEFIINAN